MFFSVQILLFLTILSSCVLQKNDEHPVHSRVLDNVYKKGSATTNNKAAYTVQQLPPKPIYNNIVAYPQQQYPVFVGQQQPMGPPAKMIGPPSRNKYEHPLVYFTD